jgi:Flp pilus assembly protein TadB
MDTKFPNENEKKKLIQMTKSNQLTPIWVVTLLCVASVIFSLLDKHPILQIVMIVTIVAGMIYLLLNFALLKRCPRCSSWGTAPHGNCPKCGMYLNPLD